MNTPPEWFGPHLGAARALDSRRLEFELPEFRCATTVDRENQTIQHECLERAQGLMRRHYLEILRLKDERTRAALIELGWTPPAEEPK